MSLHRRSAENADEAAMTENTDTNAAAEAQEAEAPAEIYAGRFTTTAYCSCRRCCRGGKRTALNPAPFRRQDIPFPPTCAYSRSEPNSASTALSIPSRTAAAASAETNWTSSSIPTVEGTAVWKEKRRCLYCPIITLILSKRVLQIENLSPARPFFIILILLNPSAPYDISFSGKFSK